MFTILKEILKSGQSFLQYNPILRWRVAEDKVQLRDNLPNLFKNEKKGNEFQKKNYEFKKILEFCRFFGKNKINVR